jgi:ribosomal protein L37AE/L43A
LTLNNKQPNLEYSDLASFFPSLSTTNSELKEHNDQSKQKNKSEGSRKSIKKTILIRRRSPKSDIWICNSCTWTGDKWLMEKHPCKQNIRNNFAKIAQQFQE